MKDRSDGSKAKETYPLYDLINCEVEQVTNKKALFSINKGKIKHIFEV